jgi:hypothetical protein
LIRETDADEFFRRDAERLGYMYDNPHCPGHGRGLWHYYADHNLVPPEKLDRRDRGPVIAELDPAAIDRIISADRDGSPLPRQNGRHTRPVGGEW